MVWCLLQGWGKLLHTQTVPATGHVMTQVMFQDAKSRCFQVGQSFILRDQNPCHFHSILQSPSARQQRTPSTKFYLLILFILITSFVGLFSFPLHTASVWSSPPSHKITSSIKKSLVPFNAWPRGYQLQLEEGIIKPFTTSLVLYQRSTTLHQFSLWDAVLCLGERRRQES